MGSALQFVARLHTTFKINILRRSFENFFMAMTQQLQSIYITALGASPVQLGLATSLGGTAAAIQAPISGGVADKYGIKALFMIGTPIMAFASLLFAIAPNWIMVIPALFVLTFIQRFNMVGCQMVCGSCLKSNEMGTGMTFCETIAGMFRLVAPIVAAYLVTAFGGLTAEGIRPLYFIKFIGLCLVTVLVWRLFRNPEQMISRKTSLSNGLIAGFREVFKEGKKVKIWLGFVALATTPMTLNMVYWPLFAKDVKGTDPYLLGVMASAALVLPIFLGLPLGKLSDTIGRKRVLYMTIPLFCASRLLLIYSQEPEGLISATLIGGVLMMPNINAITNELMPKHLLGKFLGMISLTREIVCSIIAPMVGGFLWDAFSPSYVFYFMILLEVIALPLLVTMPETLKKNGSH